MIHSIVSIHITRRNEGMRRVCQTVPGETLQVQEPDASEERPHRRHVQTGSGHQSVVQRFPGDQGKM